MNKNSQLDRLANLVGIEPEYWDIWGNHHPISDHGKRALLNALGFNADTDRATAASIAAFENAPWQRALPPVMVVREGETIEIPVHVASDNLRAPLEGALTMENGESQAVSFVPANLPLAGTRDVDGREVERRLYRLAKTMPIGYHRLAIDPPGGAEMTLIVAPRACYLPEPLRRGDKTWGVVAHLYSLRSPRNWGVGDFTDLAELVDVAAGLGAAMVGLNPLHTLFLDEPERASPYSPSSRLFLNPIFIDVEAVAEFENSPEARAVVSELAAEIGELRNGSHVDYSRVITLKRRVLEVLFEAFSKSIGGKKRNARADAFAAFRAECGEPLRRLAIFDALIEHIGTKPWQEWQEPYRDPTSPDVAAFAEDNAKRVRFFEYLQWIADEQLGAAQDRAMERGMMIGLYRDLAIGAAPDGAEAWSAKGVVIVDASVGAPPDPFNMLGQDWGIPPLSPHAMRDNAYAPFIAILRANMRHAGALRIDHVMGLMHLFWIPANETAASGAYLKYPFEDLMGVLALESHRNRCLVIGEDLGTVPEGFREVMAEANMLSYKVFYFEKDSNRFKQPDEYPHLALACVSTHDLATLRGYWTGADIDLKQRLNLYPTADAEDGERGGRGHDRFLMLSALSKQGLLPEGVHPNDAAKTPMTPALAAAIHHYLARSPASLVLVQVDDLAAEGEQLNLPGTVDERPNWRRRLALNTDELATTPTMLAMTRPLTGRSRLPPKR